MAERSEVVYAVDASDAIVEVNPTWTEFAAVNGGEALVPPGIIGQSLWRFVADPTTTSIYRSLFERIRGGAGDVRFSFRCDGPTVRRLLGMTIVTDRKGWLTFSVRTVRLENRNRLDLLDPTVRRTGEHLRMCAWCKRIPDASGAWMEIEKALPSLGLFEAGAMPALTHGMCEDCEQSMMEAIVDPTLAASGSVSLGAFV